MDGLTLFWTKNAINQRNHIFKYWNERNKSTRYSKKLNLAIRQQTDTLKTFPELGKPTTFKNTKVVIMRHYSILYQIQNSKIIITAFWDNRDDPEKLLRIMQKE